MATLTKEFMGNVVQVADMVKDWVFVCGNLCLGMNLRGVTEGVKESEGLDCEEVGWLLLSLVGRSLA